MPKKNIYRKRVYQKPIHPLFVTNEVLSAAQAIVAAAKSQEGLT